jgi:hypothetical protein
VAAAPGSRYARIDFHCSAGTEPWIASGEKLGYQDAILKLFYKNAERGLRPVRRYPRGR